MIVDDEPLAREGLRIRLRREPDVIVIGEHGDGDSALRAMASDAPDLLFLDIQMPGTNGFELLERMKGEAMPIVIFVTAYDEHALRAFDARALDYLLKPVEQERLRESLDRARERVASARNGEFVQRVQGLSRELLAEGSSAVPSARPLDRIAVSVEGTIHFIIAKEIDYVAASGDSVIAHVGTTAHVIRKSMSEMLSILDPKRFARVHRSTIVNLSRVVKVEPYLHGEYILVLQGGAKVKVSRGYRAALSEQLGIGGD
jgi:two-component system LytT family response regulator